MDSFYGSSTDAFMADLNTYKEVFITDLDKSRHLKKLIDLQHPNMYLTNVKNNHIIGQHITYGFDVDAIMAESVCAQAKKIEYPLFLQTQGVERTDLEHICMNLDHEKDFDLLYNFTLKNTKLQNLEIYFNIDNPKKLQRYVNLLGKLSIPYITLNTISMYNADPLLLNERIKKISFESESPIMCNLLNIKYHRPV